MDISAKIEHLKPCRKAKSWLESQSFYSPQQAWEACPNGSWLLWLIGKHVKSEPWSDDRKLLLACALDCAEIVSHLWSQKTTDAVAALRQWVSGTATVDAARAAADAADAARAAAYAAHATAYAAHATAYAAHAAARAAANAAYAAAYAANAAADAAADAAAHAAYAAAHAAYAAAEKQCADIVRRHYPVPPAI